MKKMKVILLSAVLVLGMSLTACGEKEAGTSAPALQTEKIGTQETDDSEKLFEEKYSNLNLEAPDSVVEGICYVGYMTEESDISPLHAADIDNEYADVKMTCAVVYELAANEEDAITQIDEYINYLEEQGYSKEGAVIQGYLFLKDEEPLFVVKWLRNKAEDGSIAGYRMFVYFYEKQ